MQHSKNVVVPITTAILLLLSAICSLGQRDPSGRAEAPAKPTNESVAEKVPKGEETDKFGIYINIRPLKDFAKEALAKIDANEVKLDSNFKVVIQGSLGLGRDGKAIVLKNPRPVPSGTPEVNDPAMVRLVQDAILAIGDAGWFGYLDKLKANNIVITVEQNDTGFTASVLADQPTENDAKMFASGFNSILAVVVRTTKGYEQTLLKMAKASFEGKSFLLTLEIPKTLAQEMFLRKVSEMREELK